jgi:hypothetical protein
MMQACVILAAGLVAALPVWLAGLPFGTVCWVGVGSMFVCAVGIYSDAIARLFL